MTDGLPDSGTAVLTASATGAKPATPKPEAERGFRPDVQGLRAIAVSIVVIYHLYPSVLPGGYVGVDVFFVISGFLITGHLARTFQRTGRVGLLDFYGRRARRLIPAAVLVLAATWLASLVVLPVTQLSATAEQIRASALYFQNWILARNAVDYLKSDQAASPVQHFWSLSVEEQFYLVWPLLFLLSGLVAFLVSRRVAGIGSDEAATRVGRPVMFGLAVAVVVTSLAYSAYLTDANPAAAYFVTTTRMWELGLGGALALLAPRVADRLGRVGALAWVGLGLVVLSAFVITGSSPFPGTIALLPVGGAVLLIAAGSRAGKLGPWRLTSARPMVFLGDISYSLYLWHWPIIVFYKEYWGRDIGRFSGPVIAAVSVLLAWLTKVFVEDKVRLAPFIARHRGRSLATALVAIIPVTMVTVWLVAQPAAFTGTLDSKHPGAAVLAGEVKSVPSATAVPPLVNAATDYAIASTDRCQAAVTATTPVHCTFGDTTHPKLTIALVGDSVAGQWSSALDEIGKKRHWKIVSDTHSSCPWTSVATNFRGGTRAYSQCLQWGKTVLTELLTTIKPDAVITSDRMNVGVPSHQQADGVSRSAIGRGMARYWSTLAQHGIAVVALRETPEMHKAIPDCLAARGATVDKCSEPQVKAILQPTPLQVGVQAMNGKATLIDMNSLICPGKTCSPIVGNVIVYRDAHHLTKTYSQSLVPYLQRKLLTVAALRA